LVGIVKNITDYGAFIDLGGVDGLLHITDMAWKRVKHPSEVLTVGDEQKVKVLKFEAEKNRVSLGIKQLGEDPWIKISTRYPKNARLNGVVTNVTDYGCFVELEEGVEGLVHMSEMDWTNKNIQPNKKVKVGDKLEVMVLDIDENRRRISLGLKQCQNNPWETFSSNYQKDTQIKGKIRSITDFGIFIGLDGNIDGLVHLSDISWDEAGEIAVKKYSKGDEVEAVILSVDPERERISLGIKQMTSNPVAEFYNAHAENKNQLFSAEVVSVERNVAHLKIESNSQQIMGILKSSDYSYDRVENLADEMSIGDHIDVKLLWSNNHGAEVRFSHKIHSDLKDEGDDSSSKKTTLGDIFKKNDKE
jgi:small subunit ribosomal protein S1